MTLLSLSGLALGSLNCLLSSPLLGTISQALTPPLKSRNSSFQTLTNGSKLPLQTFFLLPMQKPPYKPIHPLCNSIETYEHLFLTSHFRLSPWPLDTLKLVQRSLIGLKTSSNLPLLPKNWSIISPSIPTVCLHCPRPNWHTRNVVIHNEIAPNALQPCPSQGMEFSPAQAHLPGALPHHFGRVLTVGKRGLSMLYYGGYVAWELVYQICACKVWLRNPHVQKCVQI